jgi:sporulation protein YlmC with PRC-barrel domain
MSEVVTRFNQMPVYTARGKYVGHVGNVILDLENHKVASLLITDTNPEIVDGGRNVAVPYRWVQAVEDIIILASFPQRIEIQEELETEEPLEERLEREIAAP